MNLVHNVRFIQRQKFVTTKKINKRISHKLNYYSSVVLQKYKLSLLLSIVVCFVIYLPKYISYIAEFFNFHNFNYLNCFYFSVQQTVEIRNKNLRNK